MIDHQQPTSIKVKLSDGTEVLMEINTSTYDGPVSVQEMEISAKRALKAVSSLATDIKEAIVKAKPDKATAEFSIELEKKGDDIMSKICNVLRAALNSPLSGILTARKNPLDMPTPVGSS